MNDRGIDQVRRDNGSHFGQRSEVDPQRPTQGGYGWNEPRADERSWQGRDERFGYGQDDRQIYGRDDRSLRDQDVRYSWGHRVPERSFQGGGYVGQPQERGFDGGYPQGVYGPQQGYGYGSDRGWSASYGAPGGHDSQGRGFQGGGYGQPGSFGSQSVYGGQSDFGQPVHFGQPAPFGFPGSFASQGGHGPQRGYGSDEPRGAWTIHNYGYGAQSTDWTQRGPGRGVGSPDQGWAQRSFSEPSRRGRAPKSYQRSDERIKEDICDRLMHGWVDAENVEVRVVSGEVTLTGVVDDRQAKRAIEDLAEQILGVREVQNQIRVQPHEPQRPHAQSSTAGTTTPKKPTA